MSSSQTAGAGGPGAPPLRFSGNNGSSNTYQAHRRRFSYLIPPPPAWQPAPLLVLPSESHAARSRRGNPNPLILLAPSDAEGDVQQAGDSSDNTRSRRRISSSASLASSSSASGPSGERDREIITSRSSRVGGPASSVASSSAASANHFDTSSDAYYTSSHHNSGAHSRARSAPHQRHPEHTLGVSALAIDASTITDASSAASPSSKKGKSPAGILYSGGRDGLVVAWELDLPFKRREASPHLQLYGYANGARGQNRYRPRWSEEAYESDDEDGAEDLEVGDNTGGDGEEVSSSSDEEDQLARGASNTSRQSWRTLEQQQQQQAPRHGRNGSLKLDTSSDGLSGLNRLASGLQLDVRNPAASSKHRRKDRRQHAHDLPYESRWCIDQDALADRDRPRPAASFRQAHRGHTDWVNDLLLCNLNQTVISASSDRTIRAWNPHDPHRSMLPASIGTHSDYVKCLAHSRTTGWLASGGFDKRIKLWDVAESRANPIIDMSIEGSVYALGTNTNGTAIACGTPEKIVRVFDPRSAQSIARLVGHAENVRSLIVSEDGRHILSASSDATVKLWSVSMQRCLHTFTHHSDSVWALHSGHPHLEIFYSGDRAGAVCKVDFTDCGDIASEGECVILLRNRDEYRPGTSGLSDGINKIVALDDAFVWTASGSSNICRWKDVPPRLKRAAGTTAASRTYTDPLTQQQQQRDKETQSLLGGSPSLGSGFSPSREIDMPILGRTTSTDRTTGLTQHPSVAFAPSTSIGGVRSSLAQGPNSVKTPSSLRFSQKQRRSSASQVYSSSPSAAAGGQLASSPRSYEDPFNPRSPPGEPEQEAEPSLNMIPLESLVPLFTPDDPYALTSGYNLRPAGHGYSASVLSLHRTTSRPALTGASPFGGASFGQQQPTVTPPSSNLSAGRMPISFSNRAGSPMTNALLGYNRPSSIMEEEEDATPYSNVEKPKLSKAYLLAQREFEERESALDGIPMRSGPEEVIRGRHGLVRAEMLNDRRTVISLDTFGDVAVWDVVLGGCIGRFDQTDLRNRLKRSKSSSRISSSAASSSSDGGGDSDSDDDHAAYHEDVLDFVRRSIEGEAVIPAWCTLETKTGSITVHLEQNRAFDAEVYLDESGVPPKPDYRVDQRLNLGKWVLRNLLDGFIKEEIKAQSQGRKGSLAGSMPLPQSQALRQPSVTSLQSSSGGHDQAGSQSLRQDQRRPSHISISELSSHNRVPSSEMDASTNWAAHFGQTPGGFSIALATPAMTPAVLPDMSDLAAQMASPRLMSSSLQSSSTMASLPTIPQSPLGGGSGGVSMQNTPMTSLHQQQREGDYFSFTRPQGVVSGTPDAGTATPRAMTASSSAAPSGISQSLPGASAGSLPSSNPSVGTSNSPVTRLSKMSRFKSFGKKDSSAARREASNDSIPAAANAQDDANKLANGGEQAVEDEHPHLTPAEKAQHRLLQAIFSHPLSPSPWLDTPAIRFASDLAIMISEEAHDAGAWATIYRGLVSSASQDTAMLEMCMPAWLLEFSLHNVVPHKDQAKIAFVMEPWGGPEKAGLPELPSGNARLSASRMLRMRKACHYIAEKLELESYRQRQAYQASLDNSSTATASAGNGQTSAAATESDLTKVNTRTSLSSSGTSYAHHHQYSNATHASDDAAPNLIPEDEVEILCNDQIVPLNITLAACQKFIHCKGGDVLLSYRRRRPTTTRGASASPSLAAANVSNGAFGNGNPYAQHNSSHHRHSTNNGSAGMNANIRSVNGSSSNNNHNNPPSSTTTTPSNHASYTTTRSSTK